MEIEQLWALHGKQAEDEYERVESGLAEPTWLYLLYTITHGKDNDAQAYMDKVGRRNLDSVTLWHEYRMKRAKGRKNVIDTIKRKHGIVEDEVAEIALDDVLLDDEVVEVIVKAVGDVRKRVSNMVR